MTIPSASEPLQRSLPAHLQKALASHQSTHRIGFVARNGSDSTFVETVQGSLVSLIGFDGVVFHAQAGSQLTDPDWSARNAEYCCTVTSVWSTQ